MKINIKIENNQKEIIERLKKYLNSKIEFMSKLEEQAKQANNKKEELTWYRERMSFLHILNDIVELELVIVFNNYLIVED